MNTYFARQPILDADLRLFAYELLYRGGPQADSAGTPLDGDKATAAVMESFQTIEMSKITGGKRAFVNFSEKLLLDGVPTLFSPQQLVVEILENIEPTPALIEAVIQLKKSGFIIALDDFEYAPVYQPFVDLANIIKIDFLDGVFTMKNMRSIIANIDTKKCVLLAEKVESQEVFKEAYRLGCRLFQGYFFAKPATMSEPTLGMTKMSCMRLITESNQEPVNFSAIAKIIKSDLSLSFRILKLVNSAYFALPNEIRDIQQAVVFLGQTELKKWISFVSLSDMCTEKPPELIQMSMIRAHFCERAAISMGRKQDAEALFLAGMFSLLDALMDGDMETILLGVMVPNVTRDALLEERNIGRYTIDLIIALERGQWNDVKQLCKRLKITTEMASELYVDALAWGNEFYGF